MNSPPRSKWLVLLGLFSLVGCNPPDNTPEGNPACAAFESAMPSGATIYRIPGPSVRVTADAPSKVNAESVSYSITDGTSQHDGEVTGDTDVSVTIPTQNPGPWSATLVYRRDGCADQVVGPVSRTFDFVPPGPVTGLSATTETYGATLTWTNPTDADFAGVRITMKLGSPLTGFDDPDAVELCNSSVCKGTSYHVLGVPAGEVYFAVFATDDLLPGGNLADGASVRATVPGLSAWRSLSAGAVMSYGIASDGSLWGWGSAAQSPTWVSPVAPVRVGSDTDWKKVSCGTTHILAIRNDGRLFGWGGAPKQIGTATDWVDIAAGPGHSLGVRADGTLWAWGANTSGQLGDGTTTLRSEPVRVGTDSDWASIGVGYLHSLAIKKDGSLWAWGSNINGELGDGTRTNRRTPVRIGNGNDWTRVVGGYSASIGLRGTGTLWGWGYPGLNGTDPNFIVTSPAQIGTASDWTQISMSYFHVLGLRSNGTLWKWGGEDVPGADRTKTMQIGTDSNWEWIAAGGGHSLALKSDNTRWAWGENARGQLGDGTFKDRLAPAQMP